MKVYVDDVFAQSVPTANPTIEHGHVVTIPIPPGVHNIKVKNETTVNQAFRIEGIIHKTNENGITLYDAASSGAKLEFYLEGNQAIEMFESMGNVVPDASLHLIGLGTNDIASYGAAGVDAWGNRLTAMFNLLKIDPSSSNSPPGVLFYMQGEGLADAAASNSVHQLYTEKLYDIANEYPNVTIVEEKDLWTPLPGSTLDEQNPIGWLADTVHHGILPARIMAQHAFKTLFG